MSGKLKEVRDRIASINSTQQITSAMKMVSAAKLKKSQDAIIKIRPYANRLHKMLANVLANLEGDISTKLHQKREINNVLLVVVTSNRGLCGAFNANIIKKAEKKILHEYAELRAAGNLHLLCIGKKGYEHFSKHYKDCPINKDYLFAFDHLSSATVHPIADMLMDSYENGQYDLIEVAYAVFKNAAIQYPTLEQYLPIIDYNPETTTKQHYIANYIFEPDKHHLLSELIPNIMKSTFLKYMLDTNASEHGARMSAMENATENARELLKDLKLEYNKARQEAITSELSEIVGGAAALS
ncbi:MAG TPA: ATP synthase F1 subunit gamma [Saprospirales bacterium]|nr:ATP synthase F1 subunit gamma [Saprospirales bacterium]HAY71819.1 ATP synthase F1 subunit gamma [Saprospirales bacterium]HRQ29892.1 ATP synthase F1 subunit gamma [Saprospiraceae bacterium]